MSASTTSRLVLKNVVLEQPAARDFVRAQFARFQLRPIGWTSRARPSTTHSWSGTPASTSPWIRFPTMVERQPWKPSGKASRCSALPTTAGPRGSAPRCGVFSVWSVLSVVNCIHPVRTRTITWLSSGGLEAGGMTPSPGARPSSSSSSRRRTAGLGRRNGGAAGGRRPTGAR